MNEDAGNTAFQRQKLIVPSETVEDQVVNLSLRPRTLNEFIGQEDLKKNLAVSLEAARRRNEPLEHVLFSGPPGLGKTTLAHIVAHEMGARLCVTSGPAIERAGDLIGLLTNLEEGDVLFIDEIHRLNKTAEEFLYPAMENFVIDFVVDKGPYARTINFRLKRFTVIGATTRSGLLASPLRDRFGLLHHLDFYETASLQAIVQQSALKLGVEITDEAALTLARRARGTPRIANRLLRRVRDYALVQNNSQRIDGATVEACMDQLNIDAAGLDDFDRRLLNVMAHHYGGGPVGIEALAATLNEEIDTLVDVVEPYLLKSGFLKRTARGRSLTPKAFDHLGLKTKQKNSGITLFDSSLSE